MRIEIIDTTHTFFGRPYTVYPIEYLHPHSTLNTSITLNNKITTTLKNNANCFGETIHKHCQTHNTQDNVNIWQN